MREARAGCQSRNLVWGTGAVSKHGRVLPAYWLALPGLPSTLSYRIQDRMLRVSVSHRVLGLPTSAIDLEKAPTDMSKGQYNRSNFSIEGPSAQVSSVCVVGKNKQAHTYIQTNIYIKNTHMYIFAILWRK